MKQFLKEQEASRVEIKALRASNSRLMAMLDQKSVEALSAFQRRRTGDDSGTFASGEHVPPGEGASMVQTLSQKERRVARGLNLVTDHVLVRLCTLMCLDVPHRSELSVSPER